MLQKLLKVLWNLFTSRPQEYDCVPLSTNYVTVLKSPVEGEISSSSTLTIYEYHIVAPPAYYREANSKLSLRRVMKSFILSPPKIMTTFRVPCQGSLWGIESQSVNVAEVEQISRQVLKLSPPSYPVVHELMPIVQDDFGLGYLLKVTDISKEEIKITIDEELDEQLSRRDITFNEIELLLTGSRLPSPIK